MAPSSPPIPDDDDLLPTVQTEGPANSPSPLDRLTTVLRFAGALVLIAIYGLWAWNALRWEDRLELVDHFGSDARIRSFMQRAEGLATPEGGLAVPGGELAVRTYGLSRNAHHRLMVEIETVSEGPGRYGAWIRQGDVVVPLDPVEFDGDPISLSDLLPPGNVMLELWIENTGEKGEPPSVLLNRLKIVRTGKVPRPDWPTFLFYGTAGFFFWGFVLLFAIPEGIRHFLEEREELTPSSRLIQSILLLSVLIAGGWMLTLPEWTELKDYDDRAATGNAAALIDSGFDQSQVYFRSRVRPGFLAVAQPVLALFPHRLSGHWRNPSDGFRQPWLIYDQAGEPFGLFVYPALTWMSRLLAIILLLGLYGIFRKLEVPPLLAVIMLGLGAIYYGRSLTIAITQTVNLCVNILVIWHFLSPVRGSESHHRFGTGLLLGLAFLIKETAATTVIALALFTLIDGPARAGVRRAIHSIPMWIGALIWPVTYFGGIAEGGFQEIFGNFSNHLDQGEMNPFEALTWSTGLRDLRVVFSIVGLCAVALGLVSGAAERFKSRADRFMLCWAIGCLPVFALPYIFPRFLKYFVPSFAYWSVRIASRFVREEGSGENA